MLYDAQVVTETAPTFPTAISSKKFSVLLVDDDDAIRSYLTDIFKVEYSVYNAHNGVQALDMIKQKQPDLVISDIIMEGMDGLSLCKAVKSNAALNHIQIILLTSSTSDSTKLAGIQYGADDYIHKPFDSEILLLRVKTLLQNKKNLQDFFFKAITLQSNELKIPITDKLLIERCIEIIEENLLEELTVISLAEKTGMSHSSLYKKIKTISGKSINEFIRSVRLKKAAEMLILTDSKINEVANLTGFYDQRYFRQQFSKLFGHTPSDYVKKYRKAFQNEFHVDRP
jgi:YesN/AraC family two-component response regulator